MKYQVILFSMVASICLQLGAQELEIKPYIQDVEPNSAVVMWQTSEGEESIVEWGTSPKLGKKSKGTSDAINFDKVQVHTVKIEGLDRFTEYYYRVRTGKMKSDIFQFKTSPFSDDGEDFKLVAMSDMQYDHNQPDKFSEVVNEGVIGYLEKEFGGTLPDNLAMVLIPGDLVERGSKFFQWKDHFFNPAEKLFSEVPVYPVPGNHERNSVYYFKYFSLPENGTPAYAEHWWYKDYGNTRVIGLDSNDGYRDLYEQLEWLKKVLVETEKDDKIDFVFAQLHHPYKSELWIPGEEDFTGKIVKELEQFSTKTGKPSIHFFGHTHGYSRGQSKDHKHLWINVASAGGAIDNWGEFEGRDYDEFTVTQDEYGFVMVSVDGDRKNPKFTIKRISRGNTIEHRENELRDSITIWRNERKPNTPEAISPVKSDIGITNVVFKAGEFKSSYSGTFHAASHWQISSTKSFEKPAFDRWKQHENWYYKENRQKDDDLTDEEIKRLKPNTTYYWRVRYRDQNLNWSDWSSVKNFKTKEK
ncbi:fibronectin type III domain-containing protein [Aurantibacter crassamenti]|uniref:fibronectin type III domain-containing protein n=1 Tax=Aurantibacter crassamenti TaxID=1837375 RepID=UPI0019396412|nr:fibronectin type III domain-containing protein [Aurantibacter crassamenti]MBM1105082.1 fibronectin type III domain-containing protein [Aurantibacter crassamenti]